MLTFDSSKISEFRDAMSTQGKQAATIDGYSRDMANFLKFTQEMNVHSGDIGLVTIEEFKNWQLEKGSKQSSIRRSVIAVRMFFRWLEEAGQIHGNPLDDAPVPAHDHQLARAIEPEKIELMLSLARCGDSSLKAARDVALVLLLAREGLKASEIVSLCWHHFFASGDSGRLTVPGDRARTVGMEAETSMALKSYRETLRLDSRTSAQLQQSSPMFLSFKGADARMVQFGITRHGLKFAIYELGAAAEIPQLNAEQLRHVAMAHKLALGYTPDMVMSHLGLRRIGNIGKHITPTGESDFDAIEKET
jgi:site-specific recombinase XerD